MLKKPQRLTDDLFESSSMSFGDHLEELRKAMTKAFIWVGIGGAIGLYFGEHVVKFIEVPLEASIGELQIKRFTAKYREFNNREPSPKVLDFMIRESVVSEVVWVDPSQLEFMFSQGRKADGVASQSEGKAADKSTTDSSTGKNLAPTLDSIWEAMDDSQIDRLVRFPFFRPMKNKLKTFSLLEPFMIWFKTGLVAGIIIASPGIFYHIWEFLAAGLYPHERRYVYWYMPLSLTLFLSGVLLAFFVIFPLVMEFLLNYNSMLDVEFEPRLSDYMSFAIFLPLGFGIAFQLPVVMVALNRFGIVSVELFKEKWRIAVLIIAFFSMVLTPQDIYSMLGMFIPLTILYFVGIFLCKYMPRGPGLGSQALDPQG